MKWIAVLAVCGCNQVFGLQPTLLRDAGSIDSSRLLLAPDAGAACGAPPSFETWTYSPHAITGAAAVIHPTFTTANRVVFGDQGNLYESGLDDGVAELTSLDFGDGARLMNASAAPGGDVLWYLRFTGAGGGLDYAVRGADTWTQHMADFGVVGYQLQPGPAAFYAGEVRMVIGVEPTNNTPFGLVELSSPDGTNWTALDTLAATTGDDDFDPALSQDGCFVVFSHGTLAGRDLYMAARGGDGNFLPATKLVAASTPTDDVQPAIDPTGTRLWFNTGTGLIEGLAP